MSALSTPGGGGTSAQSKPTSGKQKYQKLDINSLYCANRNENSEPSSVKSQLSRKHGMQSLGKVPSARRPPANLPSLKTETGQDPNSNSISATSTTVSTPASCTSQTTTTTSSSSVVAGSNAGGWVALPPPSSPHFRTEFPSLEASAQPSHRASDHSQIQLSLRPSTEGNWTCGGGSASGRDAAGAAAATASQQTQTFRAILPAFLMKGSVGGGLGLGSLGSLRERSSGGRAARPAPPRPADVLSARPILRDDQISSLDHIASDAGWAQNDDIDYDQKLDFSDGESTAAPVKPVKSSSNTSSSNRASIESERVDSKMQETGDEDQLRAVRRQKQNEIAQAVARAKQLKEEEQRRQMRDSGSSKDSRDKPEREDCDRNDNRDRDYDLREKDRVDNRDRDRDRDRMDRDKDRMDRDKDRGDVRDRDPRDKERLDNRDRDRFDRFDNRDRDRDVRDRDRDRDRPADNRGRMDARDRLDSDKERNDRDRNDNRDRDRYERDRERNDRDRDFRDRDNYNRNRDYQREREKPAYQPQIAPRFLKQQQSRQQDDHKNWAFGGKQPPRKQDPPPYNPPPRHPPHNGRQSYSRDVSDREDDFRRERDGPAPQWRSEMQDYDRPRDLDRSNSKESYKDYDYKEKRGDSDHRKEPVEHNRTAADKLSEVFERKSVGLAEPFAASEPVAPAPVPERRITPPSNISRNSSERDFGKASWAEVAQEEAYAAHKASSEKALPPKTINEPPPKESSPPKDIQKDESKPAQPAAIVAPMQQPPPTISPAPQQQKYQNSHAPSQNLHHNQVTHSNSQGNLQSQNSSLNQTSFSDTQTSIAKPTNQLPTKPANYSEQVQKQTPIDSGPQVVIKPVHVAQRPEKDFSETESVASKASVDPSKVKETTSVESLLTVDGQKRSDDKRNERGDQKLPGKEPVERKSSGSGSEKKGRGYGGGSGYPVVYNRGWGARDPRPRRAPRAPRDHHSDSDASIDAAPHERKERRRAPRSPRPHKKEEAARHPPPADPAPSADHMENREPFAPRGQPSRRGRGGFQGTTRPPAPAKRVTGYGPPNTKSPFSQASRAVRDGDDAKDAAPGDDKGRGKPRTGSSSGRGRERRGRAHSGEDENWETTSEHSEGGTRRRPPRRAPPRAAPARPPLRAHGNKKDDNKADADAPPAVKKDEEVVDDGFQEVRNKKNSKDARGSSKEDNQKQPRSHSNQGGRNQSVSRNGDKARAAAPAPGKPGAQYDRARQQNLAPRFVKQRQKQQLGLGGFGPDTGAAPPPPAVNAWDKPIAPTLRATADDPEPPRPPADDPAPAPAPAPAAPAPAPAVVSGVLDGTTPPVETIIFENTNYKTAPPADALKPKYQPNSNTAKPQTEEPPSELEARPIAFNGEVRPRPRSIQELIGDNGRPVPDGENALGLQMSFDASQKAEDSSDMKLDFAFDSDLGQLTEDKSAKSLGLPRGTHMSTSNTISPLAADLNLKIASVKKVWEMPAVAEGSEELQFAAFEENNAETGAPPNVCKVKPTQQLQSPPPQHYNHVSYQGGYGGLSVPSPPAVLFNSSQPLLGSSQQLPQQGSLYGAFLDQSRGQFGGFPGTPYAAQSATPYNYPPAPDMFPSIQSQYRMAAAAAGGGAAFGQSGQLGNSPSTMLISSTSNSLMSATVKPTTQQIGAIGSKGNVGQVGGVGGVNTYQQQYMGYSTPVGDAAYPLQGLLPRAAPPASSYYSAYQQGPGGPAYPLQFQQQQSAFGSQYLTQVAAAAVQQMQQQQYRGPMQQQYAAPTRPPQPQLKSPLHEHANGFAPLCDAGSPTPKKKPAHSPPHHKYLPPQHQHHHQQPHQHQQHHAQHQHHQQHQQHPQHQQQQQQVYNQGNVNGRGARSAPRYPAPIQRPPAPPQFRPAHHQRHTRPMYYHAPPRNGSGGGGGERPESEPAAAAETPEPAAAEPAPAPAEVKAD